MSAAIAEYNRVEGEKYAIDNKWDDELVLTSPEGVSKHDRIVMDNYIQNSRSIEKTICMINHCKRMIAIEANWKKNPKANDAEGGCIVCE